MSNTRSEKSTQKIFYTYIYLDPRKVGNYEYDDSKVHFDFEPIYVGKGYELRLERHWEHIIKNWKISKSPFLSKLKSLHNKGLSPIIIKIRENITEREAFDEEIRLIWVIGRKDLDMGSLLNRTWGGDGNSGRILSEEEKKVLSEKNKGEKNGFYGKTHTLEVREAQSKRKSDVPLSPKHKEKIRQGMVGKNTWLVGIKQSEATKKKRSESLKKAWEQRKREKEI